MPQAPSILSLRPRWSRKVPRKWPLKGSGFAKAQEAKVKTVEKQHEDAQEASVDVLNTNVPSSTKAPTPKSAKAGAKGKK